MTRNRLASEQSAYLRAASVQPVHWHPWGAAAFEHARSRNQPVLLDIGAAWCHWCHVMDRESYESDEIASLLNEHFTCIKVDRDERPDIDARYQRAVQLVSGEGGWPLTVFLTPDGEAFFGGTYFPPANAHGRPGLRTLLASILDAWTSRRDQVGAQAATLTRIVGEQLIEAVPGTVSASLLTDAAASMLRVYDPEFGGFGRRPKFPHPAAIRFLLARWHDTGDAQLREVIQRTLDAMALGGMHDQLGGGFHRYSVDERWVVPHFEKMAYDNAELLRAYVEGWLALGEAPWAEVARGIMRWVSGTLAQVGGGYGASQDADVGLDDDGNYYTWSRSEAAAVLTPEELAVAADCWDIGAAGEMQHDPSRNVLFQAMTVEAVGRRLGLEPERARAALASARRKLLAERARRPTPAVDQSRYTAWNAMLVSAMLIAGTALDDPPAVAHALATLDRIGREAPAADRVAHGAGGGEGWLEDSVQVADAALTAFEVTGEARWLEWAEQICERTWREHEDPADGALFDVAGADAAPGLLTQRGKPGQDAPTPSANGMAGIVAARLYGFTGREAWRRRAERLVAAFSGGLEDAGLHGATLLLAADWLLGEMAHVVVTGATDDPAAAAMWSRLWRSYLPRRVARRQRDGHADAMSAPPDLAAMLTSHPSGPAGFLCIGTSCRQPARSEADWDRTLGDAERRVS